MKFSGMGNTENIGHCLSLGLVLGRIRGRRVLLPQQLLIFLRETLPHWWGKLLNKHNNEKKLQIWVYNLSISGQRGRINLLTWKRRQNERGRGVVESAKLVNESGCLLDLTIPQNYLILRKSVKSQQEVGTCKFLMKNGKRIVPWDVCGCTGDSSTLGSPLLVEWSDFPHWERAKIMTNFLVSVFEGMR